MEIVSGRLIFFYRQPATLLLVSLCASLSARLSLCVSGQGTAPSPLVAHSLTSPALCPYRFWGGALCAYVPLSLVALKAAQVFGCIFVSPVRARRAVPLHVGAHIGEPLRKTFSISSHVRCPDTTKHENRIQDDAHRSARISAALRFRSQNKKDTKGHRHKGT